MTFTSNIKQFDWIIFVAVIFLTSIGLTEIYSIGFGQSTNASFLNFQKQTLSAIISLGAFFIFTVLNYKYLQEKSYFIFFGSLLILAFLLLAGEEKRGTKGWVDVGFFNLQPVEFVKIALILAIARYHQQKIRSWGDLKTITATGFLSLSAFILVALQPDFGSGFILICVWMFSLLAASVKKKYFIIFGILAILLSGVTWNFYFEPYQQQRILTLFNPGENTLSDGYNVRQAIIAAGSGEVLGRGVGLGSQSQLKFLPESQNDFIFAVIAEEMGFLGGFLTIAAFIAIFYRLLYNLRYTNDNFGFFVIFLTAGLIFIEMFINIGMNIGLMPVVGISLPFVSYGGSSLLANFVLIGIVQNIIINDKNRVYR